MQKLTKQKRINVYALLLCFVMLIGAFFMPQGSAVQYDTYSNPMYTANTNRKVFVGGFPIGMVLDCKGVMVLESGAVSTEYGRVTGTSGLTKGDIIVAINGIDVLTIDDIAAALNHAKQSTGNIKVDIIRKNKAQTIDVVPIIDKATGDYKLGVWVKDKIAGLGTVSFVRIDGRFGALGHPVVDSETGIIFPCYRGRAYNAKILGVNKGRAGAPGELKGSFSGTANSIASIDTNNKFGVYGFFNNTDNLGQLVDVASRNDVKLGAAKVITTVGDEIGEYDIEIVKAATQKNKDDRSMVVRVTDPKLLEITGGIVQGMSGSPIIQNGKLIGAITHVFVNDPTRGYALYSDFMYDN